MGVFVPRVRSSKANHPNASLLTSTQAMAARLPMKRDRPHRCSLCGVVGHRKDTCPKARKRINKILSPLGKPTPYFSTAAPPTTLSKRLKQETIDVIQAPAEAGAKLKLKDLQILERKPRRTVAC